MATIKFYLESKKETAPIYVRFRDGRLIDVTVKTNFAINPKDWSVAKQKPKNLNDKDFEKLDGRLSDFKAKLLNHYNNTDDKNQINSNWLKNFVNPAEKVDAMPGKLVDYFDYYAKHIEGLVKPSTQTKVKVNRNLVAKFQAENNREYLIKEVNSDFKIDFVKFCKKKLYSTNTIARTLKYIKTICYHARRNGVETHFQLDDISMKHEKVEIIYLTQNEINHITAIDYKHDYLNNTRDWLIVCCETAQRVSDFMNFTKDQIRKDGDDLFIEFTQEKTDKVMSVFITPKLADLLNRNDGNFPRRISAAKMNTYVKIVCEKAGLTDKIKGSKINKETNRKESGYYPKWELVTTKIGRKSFASNYFGKLENSLIMAQTGHTKESSFLAYVGKTQMSMAKQLAEGIKNLNKK